MQLSPTIYAAFVKSWYLHYRWAWNYDTNYYVRIIVPCIELERDSDVKKNQSIQQASKQSYWMNIAQKMTFSIKDFVNKCDKIHSFMKIWSDLLKKSLIENFSFCTKETLDFNGKSASLKY